ncbi:aconitate hydratase AcnA [Sulfitobacter sp. D7]|jgi:aconitate hydratase|uniref:aconitate hydratase AcnA n=1 Tax=Sulfitobacter sp. D7 TaxID=1968541 RepID=UPI000E7769A2|nr:aconitate hydratase AcnA [Sulfitobacter sp. D7]AYE85338.1 aconitate hydratase 1 [Sulfitobacter sp. D7]
MENTERQSKDIATFTTAAKGGAGLVIDLTRMLSARANPLPRSLRVVLENLAVQARRGAEVEQQIATVTNWHAGSDEITVPLAVSRVMLPDSSGLPALMDLAAARDVFVARGEDPGLIEPAVPVTLVVDHSLIVDVAGHPNARQHNIQEEYRRNSERYAFFKWAEQAFDKLKVVPPGSGIIHQVHLERIASVVTPTDVEDGSVLTTEFVLGCDSHTSMAGGLGMLAWGVGGIDGEAAALGLPYEVRIPRVVGVELTGALRPETTTTDLVLTITERLRNVGVVGAFVEFCGAGAESLTVPDRATIANMAPEYGATCAFFPIDAQTTDYLKATGRDGNHVAMVEAYARATGLWFTPGDPMPEYSEVVQVDLSRIVPSVAGPKRPQDRVPLDRISTSFQEALTAPIGPHGFGIDPASKDASADIEIDGKASRLHHGSLTIAAITSCTNTSNPSVMLAAGLLARNAVARGLRPPVHVKTSMAPGSRLVEDYLAEAGLMAPLETLGFHVVGIGCTTCSGKSGPLAPGVSEAVADNDLICAAILSGNRNFEGRIHKSVRAAYLASPPLVVAFALTGRIDVDFAHEPIGTDANGWPVMLAEIWPDRAEIAALELESQRPESFRKSYATLFDGSELWDQLEIPLGPVFEWSEHSTYIKRPPFVDLATADIPDRLENARALVVANDSLTTDFITPSGEILPESQAGKYLIDTGVEPKNFNAVTQRRGNHEFMARVTFANQRMKNALAGGVEGGFTKLSAEGENITIYDAAKTLRHEGVPAIILAGKDYGMGSSRDWAAKGPKLLGVVAVLAESFERIHRANLIGMGITPLVFPSGTTLQTLKLSGFETFCFDGLDAGIEESANVRVTAQAPDGTVTRFDALVDVTSLHERGLLRAGGVFSAIMRKADRGTIKMDSEQ